MAHRMNADRVREHCHLYNGQKGDEDFLIL